MRPTRLGLFAVALTGFALFAAASTGNNLIYLLFSATAAALILSAAAAALNLRGLSARLEPPERIFRGAPFSARVVAENAGAWTARMLFAAGPLGRAALGDAAPG
ncbi:MAG: hypothetical protein KGM24_13690, partial [Elusimicrobia bacterium]|nr:hypothetical protein [Elusimicrobiota bacterium]